MKTVFAVFCETNGAHGREDLMSIWNAHSDATNEIRRLKRLKSKDNMQLTTSYDGDFHIVELTLNKQSNEFLN